MAFFTRFIRFRYLIHSSVGLLLALWLSQNALAQQITTVAGGNGLGSAANQLFRPSYLLVDAAGNLYVSDNSNHRIQKFPPNSTSATAGITVAGGNGSGSAANQLFQPQGLYMDQGGYLYVADLVNQRIQKFPPNSTSATAGVTIAGGNGLGSAANQFEYPGSVVVDGSGNLLVVDINNSRVQKFPPNSTSATAGVTVAGGNGIGLAPTKLWYPNGIYVDGAGNFVVADFVNDRVQKFPSNSTSATPGVTIAGGNGRGLAANQVYGPRAVCTDVAGNLYVIGEGYRVQKFPPNSTSATAGVTIAGGNGEGTAPNQLSNALGLAIDAAGNLYVLGGPDRVDKYTFPPLITSQLAASSVVCAGATVTAQVSATTTIAGPTLSYQWYSNSGPLAGQTSPTLTLSNVQAEQSNSYYVVITSSNGLTATSTTFQLTVLARPTVSLVSSGPLSAANPTVTLTASGADVYQFGPGASQVGNGPTATVSTPGSYSVVGTGSNGCSSMASVTVSQALTTDLTPALYARPTSVNASTPISVVVDVFELNGVATSGLITLKVSQQTGLNLSLPSSATTVGGRPVTNSAWSLSGPSGGYYTLTSSQVISAGDILSVGLTGSFSGSSGSTGAFTISGTLVAESGGDQDPTNNTDADRLEYFQQ